MSKLPLFEARTVVSEKVDLDILAIFQDSGKKAISPKGSYAGVIERLKKSDAFQAKSGSHSFVRFGGEAQAESVLFVGLGQISELTEEKFRSAGGQAWAKLSAERVKTIVIHVDSFFEAKTSNSHIPPIRSIRAFAEGLVLSAYEFKKYKTKAEGAKEDVTARVKVIFQSRDKTVRAQLEETLEQVTAVGEAVTLTRDWSNEPSNYGTPVYFANEAKKIAKEYGLKCKVLTEKEAQREKMGLFIGVGQGAEREGRIVVLEYQPKGLKKGQASKTLCWVGKGVTFDSGGISIKPSARMEDMKHDMTGAATIMGAMMLASSWNVPNRIVAILAFLENMPDGNAIQPGNVLTSRSGKTVEIINTDAEGRLILADALDYAHDFKPDAIVDVATLTGAVSIALGKQCCGVMGNESNLIEAVKRAGEVNGERIWELPLYDEYFEDLKSDCADMKNSANDSNGGTIRGAIFLKQFIKKGTQWAHLDIAAMAYNLGHINYYPKKGASGAYVRTLAQFAADF